MRLSSSGNVGIGNAANLSSAKLHVSGNIYATGRIAAGCEGDCEASGGYLIIFADGSIATSSGAGLSGGVWSNASDERLKTGIAALDSSSMAELMRLRPVRYRWKDPEKYSAGEQVGLIAQEVEKVYPGLVATNRDGIKSLNYGALVAPLIQAVQELKADNEQLRASYRADIRALREEIEMLKAEKP